MRLAFLTIVALVMAYPWICLIVDDDQPGE